jgi:hypothetical protein
MKSVAGENTDLVFNAEKLHIQTEDWADNGQVIVTRVFKNGSVIKTFRLDYLKINNIASESERKAAVQKLHQYAIDQIYNGKI